MKVFNLMIQMNSKVFVRHGEGSARLEVARILTETGRRVILGEDAGSINDITGNHCAEFWHEPPREI